MTALRFAAAMALALASIPSAMAQNSTSRPARHPLIGRPPPDVPGGGSPGYQANTYIRRPSPRTPTDVGNMAFPDPSQTPAGSLPPVYVGR